MLIVLPGLLVASGAAVAVAGVVVAPASAASTGTAVHLPAGR